MTSPRVSQNGTDGPRKHHWARLNRLNQQTDQIVLVQTTETSLALPSTSTAPRPERSSPTKGVNTKKTDKSFCLEWHMRCAHVPSIESQPFLPKHHRLADTIPDGLPVSGTSKLVTYSKSGTTARTLATHLPANLLSYLHPHSSWNLCLAGQDCESQRPQCKTHYVR